MQSSGAATGSLVGGTHLTALDWLMIAALLRRAALRGMVGRPKEEGYGRRLLSRRAQPGLGRHRRIDLRVEHRLGAHRRTGRLGRHQRRRDGALRTARLVPAGAGVGVRAVLHAVDGVHDAGVPGAALQRRLAVRAVDRLADHVRHLEDRRRHLRRRRRVRGAAAGDAAEDRRHGTSTASGSGRCW